MNDLPLLRAALALFLVCPTLAQDEDLLGSPAPTSLWNARSVFMGQNGGTYGQEDFDQNYPDTSEGYEELYGDTNANTDALGRRQWDYERSDARPPMALRNTIMLQPGEWAVGYRFDYQSFDGMRDARDDQTTSQVFNTPGTNYAFVPTEMTWITHTFSGYYGFDEDWTLFADIPFHDKEMDITFADSSRDTLDNSGLGDIRIGAIHDLHLYEGAQTLVHLGLGIPTGDEDEIDGGEPLPFPMQNGIGTLALHPGFTYVRQEEDWSYGMWGEGRIHLGRNDDDYSAGDVFDLSLWAAVPISRSFSASLRLAGNWRADYHGESDTIDQDRSPVNVDELQGGDRIDLFLGGQWDIGRDGRLHRLGFEVGVPMDEWLDGPQLSTEFLATIGWQVAL